MKSLEELVGELPPNLQQEVRDFVEFLAERNRPRRGGRLRLAWVGGLRKYSDQYTALELQKKALDWWGD